MPSQSPRLGLVFVFAVLAMAASQACGDRPLSVDELGDGGARATGGIAATGGRSETGGAGGLETGGTTTGGARATGGGGGLTGGSMASGGRVFTGGVATGGRYATGGIVEGTGGRFTGGAGMIATGGAIATGGRMATGGTGGTMCGPCPAPMCAPGYVLGPSDTSCCMVCQPVDCATVRCADPACPAGTHAEKAMGQCCATCMPGAVSMACQTARDQYTKSRESLIEKYRSIMCRSDKDCALVPESNRCNQGCPLAFPASLIMSAYANLNGSAQCADCPTPPSPTCPAMVAICSNGQCTEGAPILP